MTVSKSPSKSATTPTTPTTTRLTCYAPDAKQVFVAGTFNDWNPADHVMERNSSGVWEADLRLPHGRYEYKFIVDGVWCCEPHLRNDANQEDDSVPNAFGTINRVLLVR